MGGLVAFWRQPLREPFFDDQVQRCLRQPFNRLFRYTTPIARLPDWLEANHHLQPDGFIFHMSRCGSTLVSQMLGALPDSIVISEAGPIDTVVDSKRIRPDLSDDERALRGCDGWSARSDRPGAVANDSSCSNSMPRHTLDLPLFRRAFPTVPWIFLYRDPMEVLVSHMRQPGIHMVPALIKAERFGLEPSVSRRTPAAYRAQVLARICEPMVQQEALDGGLLINYRQLPTAVSTSIMPHFGITADTHEQAILAEAASRNAKMPGLAFVADSTAKQQEATVELRDLAEQWLGNQYRQLEARRLGEPHMAACQGVTSR